jgi:hypothetical protein
LLGNRLVLERYIKANGHLVLEGNESMQELREALIYLSAHKLRNCHRPHLGTPIETFIHDAREMLPVSPGRPRNVISVDMRGERL